MKRELSICGTVADRLSIKFKTFSVKTEQITLKNGMDLILLQISTSMGMKFILLDLHNKNMRLTTVDLFTINDVEFVRNSVEEDMARIIEFVDSFPYLYGSDIARPEVKNLMQTWRELRNLPSEATLVKREHKISR